MIRFLLNNESIETDLPAGEHRIAVDAATLPSGSYLYRLSGNGYSSTRTMTVVR